MTMPKYSDVRDFLDRFGIAAFVLVAMFYFAHEGLVLASKYVSATIAFNATVTELLRDTNKQHEQLEASDEEQRKLEAQVIGNQTKIIDNEELMIKLFEREPRK